jgi:dipeptidyl aminopeptidase/acylaminoacyl peptidase
MTSKSLEKIGIDAFEALRSFSAPLASPGGKNLCFVAHQPDCEKNRNLSDLWIYSKTDGPRRLTTSGTDRNPRWLNEHELIFISKRNPDISRLPKTEFYKIDIRGGEAVKAYEIPLEIARFEWIGNGQSIVEFTYHPEWHHLSEEKDILEKMDEKEAVQVIDEIPFWSNGSGFTNKTRTALGLFTPENNALEMLTDQLSNVEDWVLSPDGTHIALIQNKFKNKQVVFNSLGLCELASKTLRDVSHRDDFMYQICAFDPEGQLLFYGTDTLNYGLNENGSFFLMNPLTLEVRLLSAGFDGNCGNSVGTDLRLGSSGTPRPVWYQGAWLFVTTMDSQAPLVALSPDGLLTILTPQDSAMACYEFTLWNEAIVITALKDQLPQELYSLTLKDGIQVTSFQALTQINAPVLENSFVSIPETILCTAQDGTELTGWLLKPYDFDPLRRYTGILNIHGGPKTVYGPFLYHEMQYWASEGFAVMFMNPRGSEGKGNAFADIRGAYGTIDYEDLMCFVDAVVDRNTWIDNDRLGVTGGSYGGYMTNWIIGHTHRFKAAASQRSISNWISKFGTTDIGYFFVQDQIGADPWSDFETLWNQSPLKYAANVKTPTLFIHSDEDFRCWTAEAFQMFTALKYHGIQSKLCLFHGENHELSRSGKPKNRIQRLKEITDWMKSLL